MDLKSPNSPINSDQAQKETEKYFCQQDRAQLCNDGSYNPMTPIESQKELNSVTSYAILKDNSSAGTSSSDKKNNLNVPDIENGERTTTAHKKANTMETMIMMDDPLGKQKQTLRAKSKMDIDDDDVVKKNTMLNKLQSDKFTINSHKEEKSDRPLVNIPAKPEDLGKGDKTQSYQLNDDIIEDLMITMDDIADFDKMKSMDKQKSAQTLDYQTSDEVSTRL